MDSGKRSDTKPQETKRNCARRQETKAQLCITAVLPEIDRVTSIKILGVTMTDGLSASDHVRDVITRCAQTLYTLQVLRTHGMGELALRAVYGVQSKRRQTETATTFFEFLQTTKTTTRRNDDKPERRQTETTTRRNDDKQKRRQTETTTHRNDDKQKTTTNRNVDTPKRRQTKTATTIVTLLPTTRTATVKTTTN